MVGWSLWLAEWIALAVFPVAFTRYLMFFMPHLEWVHQAAVKALFVVFLVLTNIVGVKAAGKTNDVLTVVKLAPLVFFSGAGFLYIMFNPSVAASNLTPFSPFGISAFGRALVLIFWAYAGFEISTIPADEIRDPSSTIPKAIVLGISIVTVFYLVTNTVLFGVRSWTQLASDSAPLASATTTVLSVDPALTLVGGLIVGGGALISVAGSDESGMMGTSRLGYALAADGLFPHVFAKVHPRFKTPYLAIVIQAVTAFGASIIGELSVLIANSVLLMSIAYVATSLSIFKLQKKFPNPKFSLKGGLLVPTSGAIFSLYLISQCTTDQILVGSVLLAVGAFIYVKFSPKKELAEVKRKLVSRDAILGRTYRQEQRFLAHALRHMKRAYRKATGKKQTWAE